MEIAFTNGISELRVVHMHIDMHIRTHSHTLSLTPHQYAEAIEPKTYRFVKDFG